MKALFLSLDPSDLAEVYYEDVVEASSGRFRLQFYDPVRPIAEQLEGVEVVIHLAGQAPRDIIDAAIEAGVKLWQVLGYGLDHVDVPYFLEEGLPLAHTPGPFTAVALAEHALFLML